ncbi:TnsA endonuclease N-terminal domain-containing protein [Azospirillum sp. Marseille-Q6669]
MARKRYSFDEDKIARFQKEGRGEGTGASYKPWLTIQDVPSMGRSHRLRGWTTGRIHHLLSDIECGLFYLFDWSESVRDIREQFPLDRPTTRRIAEQLGIKHPVDTATKTPLVMTTDIVIDIVREGRFVTLARAVKPADQLDKPRTIEKLEIERRYWSERGVDWGIVTERDIPTTFIRNVAWVHNFRSLDDLSQPHSGYLAEKAALVVREVEGWPADQPLRHFCGAMDTHLAMPPGTCLMLIRHLLATKAISCNMSEPLDDTASLQRFRAVSSELGRAAG